MARPGIVCCLMYHGQNVAYSVILVLLGVVLHGISIVRMRQVGAENIIVVVLRPVVGWRRCVLSDVLTPCCLSEPIECIVHILHGWCHFSVIEENGLLSTVVNLCNVSHWIVGVTQNLEQGLIRHAYGLQTGHAESERIIGIGSADLVSVLDELVLSSGVVVEVCHKWKRVSHPA